MGYKRQIHAIRVRPYSFEWRRSARYASQWVCLFAAFRKYFHLLSDTRNAELTVFPSKSRVFSGTQLQI
jgi:hypothetical protein